jgi:ribosomal protein S18 acetylase RimI-like enzyme
MKSAKSRRKMFDTVTASLDLKVVVAAPDGCFAAICGMFYDASSRFCYVEPVATDPDYRRLGLGKAAVLEGIRRCAEQGADSRLCRFRAGFLSGDRVQESV